MRLQRQRLPVIIIVVEGHNKTETHFFESLNREIKEIQIRVRCSGETDLPNLVAFARRLISEYELQSEAGDRIFLLVDDDASLERKMAIAEAAKNSPDIKVAVSRPAFENFLLSYFACPRQNITSKEALSDLRKHCPCFSKGSDYYGRLPTKELEAAISRYETAIEADIKNTITVAAMVAYLWSKRTN
jgi:hypothetical protein